MVRSAAFVFFMLSLFPACMLGQQPVTGVPPYGSFQDGKFDTINLQNLNVHHSYPIVSVAGRGLGLNFNLTYDSAVYGIVSYGPLANYWSAGNAPGWIIEPGNGTMSYAVAAELCDLDQGYNEHYYNFSFREQNGTTHPFAIDYYEGDTACFSGGGNPGGGYATDGSGYYFNTANYPFAVFSPSGIKINPPFGDVGIRANMYDTNGNFIHQPAYTGYPPSSTDYVDTVGRTALSLVRTPTLGPPNYPTTYDYQYKFYDTNGNYQTATLHFQPFNIKTNFACPGIIEWSYNNYSLPTSLTLPNGQAYTFTYEDTPGYPGYTTMRLKRVTLPTGGYYEYQYPGGGMSCSDGSLVSMTRLVNDGTNTYTWTYTRTQTENTSTRKTWKTLVTPPQLPYDTAPNQTALFFTEMDDAMTGWVVGRENIQKQYQGAEASNQLLRAEDTTFTCSGLAWQPVCRPTRNTVTLDTNQQSKTETDYDTYGNIQETREFDLGAGASGPLRRRTTYSYLTDPNYIARNIVNRVTRVVVKDGAGNIKSRTETQYDSTPLSCVPMTPSVPQHDDTNYGCTLTFRGNPTAVTQYTDPVVPAGPITTTSVYDSLGNLRSATDPGGHTTTFSYVDNYSDGMNRNTYAYLTQTTKPVPFNSQSISSKYYYYTGQQASVTDENFRVTTFAYADVMNRPTQTNYPDGGQISISYNDPGRTISTTQKRTTTENIVTSDVFNPLGQLVQHQMPGGRKQDSVYDALGRDWKTSNIYINSNEPTYGLVETRYDGLGRVTTVVNQDQTTAQTQYSGSASKTTDETGRQRLADSDGLGRIIKVCEVTAGNARSPAESCNITGFGGTGYLTTNTYDTLDHLTQYTQGAQTRTSNYDPLGRLLSARIIEVNSATDVSYGYNNDGLRTSVTDSRGTVSFDFDELHRPKRKRYNGTVTASYGYDGPQSVNGVGRLVAENDGDFGSGTDHSDYTYDELGRVRSANRTVSSTPYPITYTYDLAGNLASLGYPSGRLVQYDLTGGQLNKVTDTTNAQAPFDYVSTVTYAPPGPLQQMNFANNVVTALSWNNRGQLASISTEKTGGSTYLSLGYGYFAAGQIQQITNNLNTSKSEKYTYDDLRRLLTAQLGPDGGIARKYQYDYDRYGNRWGQNVVAGSGFNGQLAFDTASNRVNWAGFSFDGSGNLTTNATGITFTFNQESFVTGAGAATYSIDAEGRRVRKTNGATVTDYFYSGSELLAEKAGSQWTDYIFFGDQRIAQQTGSSPATVIYLHADHLGSTRVCTDGNGNSNGTCDYEPFGETQVGSTCSVPTNFRYAGMQWDSESNLFHTWFRQYDPTQGRWMGVDPLPGSEGFSQSMGRYAYVLNDPVNGIDLYGLLAGDFLVMQGGWDFIGGQLFQCQLDGISMSCGDFADFGYLKKLWQEAAFGEWIGNYNEPGGYYIYDLALANKLLGLQLAAQPSPSPCKGLKASDIIYTAARRTHVEEDHMNYLANGQNIAPKMGAGQYVFTPQGTKDENWALVVLINAVTVTMGKPVFQPDTGNYAITFGLPPQVSDLAGNTPLPIRRWVGRAWNQNWRPFQSRYYTTNVNTVLLGPDCRTYVTSFPGVPNR